MVRQIAWFMLLLGILSLMFFNDAALAEQSATPAKPATTQQAAPKTGKATEPVKSKASDEKDKTTAPARPKPQPILMELSSTKNIYHAWDDIMVSAELWAIQPVTICMNPHRPEISFSVDLYRAGYGQIETPPTVVQLNTEDLQNMQKIQLQPGQMHRVLFNLKKVANMPPNFWKTGEYRVQTKFFLCNPGKSDDELAIRSKGPLHLLILD